MSKTTVVVGSVYRHPFNSSALSEFEETHLNSLKQIRKQNYTRILLGDVNINYNKLSVAPTSIATYSQ